MTQDEFCNGIDATMAAIVVRSGDELLDSIALSFLRNLRKASTADLLLRELLAEQDAVTAAEHKAAAIGCEVDYRPLVALWQRVRAHVSGVTPTVPTRSLAGLAEHLRREANTVLANCDRDPHGPDEHDQRICKRLRDWADAVDASGVPEPRRLSDGDIEALYMQFCPDDSLASAIQFAREVEKRTCGVEASGEETFRAEYTREELGKGVRGKYREIDWGEVDDELSDILIMCSGDQRVVLLPKLRELLRKVSGQ